MKAILTNLDRTHTVVTEDVLPVEAAILAARQQFVRETGSAPTVLLVGQVDINELLSLPAFTRFTGITTQTGHRLFGMDILEV